MPFSDAGAWTAHDLGLNRSYQGVGYDGRFVYFAPGHELREAPGGEALEWDKCHGESSGTVLTGNSLILRYDTNVGGDATGGGGSSSSGVLPSATDSFTDPARWATFDARGVAGSLGSRCTDFDGAAFDGRYIYFVPLSNGVVLRLDTHGDFASPASWVAHDVRTPFGFSHGVGSVLAYPHLYLVPYGQCTTVVRYDVRQPFDRPESWEARDVTTVSGNVHIGYDGACFDGRYVWLIPFFDEREQAPTRFHGALLRFDTHCSDTSFAGGVGADAGAWCVEDISQTNGLHTVGYNAACCDGRYLYFAPWHCGEGGELISAHGKVLRIDTAGDEGAAFSLRYCDLGHNGGLCAAMPGPRFLVSVEPMSGDVGPTGVVVAEASRAIPPRVPSRKRKLQAASSTAEEEEEEVATRDGDGDKPESSQPLQHICGVFDGAQGLVRLFVDGELVAEQRIAQPCRLSACTAPLTIGTLHADQSSGASNPPPLAGSFLGEIVGVQVDPMLAATQDQVYSLAEQALEESLLVSAASAVQRKEATARTRWAEDYSSWVM